MATKEKTELRALVPGFDYWLRLFPPRSVEEVQHRFRLRVHEGAFQHESHTSLDQFLADAFKQPESLYETSVKKAAARDFGLRKPIPFSEFNQAVRHQGGERLTPCQPWQVVMTAIILGEQRSVCMPEERKMYCVSGEDYRSKTCVQVIEEQRIYYWLHSFKMWKETPVISPDDWILFLR